MTSQSKAAAPPARTAPWSTAPELTQPEPMPWTGPSRPWEGPVPGLDTEWCVVKLWWWTSVPRQMQDRGAVKARHPKRTAWMDTWVDVWTSRWEGMAEGVLPLLAWDFLPCCGDVMIHSSRTYHENDATGLTGVARRHWARCNECKRDHYAVAMLDDDGVGRFFWVSGRGVDKGEGGQGRGRRSAYRQCARLGLRALESAVKLVRDDRNPPYGMVCPQGGVMGLDNVGTDAFLPGLSWHVRCYACVADGEAGKVHVAEVVLDEDGIEEWVWRR